MPKRGQGLYIAYTSMSADLRIQGPDFFWVGVWENLPCMQSILHDNVTLMHGLRRAARPFPHLHVWEAGWLAGMSGCYRASKRGQRNFLESTVLWNRGRKSAW